MLIFSLFFEGFLLGLGAAIPLGPINLLIMNEAIKSYKQAVAIGLGAMSADITYLVLIFYGITKYLQQEIVLQVLSFLGGVFLLYLAFLIFKGRNQHISKMKPAVKNPLLSNYIKGYLLTLLNPYTILFWLSVTTYSVNTQSLEFIILGLISAITLWITIMPYLVYSKRAMISDKLFSKIAIASSLILLFFGFSLLIKLLD